MVGGAHVAGSLLSLELLFILKIDIFVAASTEKKKLYCMWHPTNSVGVEYDWYDLTTIPFLYFFNCFSQHFRLCDMTGHMDLTMAETLVLTEAVV